MSKALVETIGDFQLADGPQVVPYNRPAVVEMNHFFQARSLIGQLRLIQGELAAAATDEEFLKFWRESAGDRELAIDSFVSVFGPRAQPLEIPAVVEEEEAPRSKRGR